MFFTITYNMRITYTKAICILAIYIVSPFKLAAQKKESDIEIAKLKGKVSSLEIFKYYTDDLEETDLNKLKDIFKMDIRFNVNGYFTGSVSYEYKNNQFNSKDIMEYNYDPINKKIIVTLPQSNTTMIVEYLDNKEISKENYYKDGKLTETKEYVYDAKGNLTTVQYTYPGKERILSKKYDSKGQIIQETDADNKTTHYVYNDKNQVTQKSFYTYNTLDAIETFNYTKTGKESTHAYYDNEKKLKVVEAFYYNSKDSLVTDSIFDGNWKFLRSVSASYNTAGLESHIVLKDAEGTILQELTIEYDQHKNPVKKVTIEPGKLILVENKKYTYYK